MTPREPHPVALPPTARLPLVTIVTPSLDQARYLPEAIESVLAQDYPRIEYRVVDGGSTDRTLALLERYGSRVRWISEPDAGQSAAINKGFALGSGELLAWLNADDAYEPGAVRHAVASLLERPEAMLVYGRARFVDAAGRDLGPCSQVEPFDLGRLLHHGDIVAQPAAFFRRAAFAAVGGLDESLQWAMDYDLWLKIARRFPVLQVDALLARYRLTGENKTARGGEARWREVEAVARRHGARGLPAAFRVERFAAGAREGATRLREGRPLAAARALARAIGVVAGSPRAWRAMLAVARERRRRPAAQQAVR